MCGGRKAVIAISEGIRSGRERDRTWWAPCGLKRVGRIFWLSHWNQLNSHKCLHWTARHSHRVLAAGRPKRILPYTVCQVMAARWLPVISRARDIAQQVIVITGSGFSPSFSKRYGRSTFEASRQWTLVSRKQR
ncbi:hypothetical protein Bxe_B2090 [Paraburkholderia xenovorans LB400]|uniref:Uncharacterized protein n=1 Tax=Paraburkholderia xenovorans (strain LB400) TaxID=266265 RepID=Q13PU2_PARXL|nr:hypothetical protein Bxe_B2090 [Paraburkholderia xenovorans LB400]